MKSLSCLFQVFQPERSPRLVLCGLAIALLVMVNAQVRHLKWVSVKMDKEIKIILAV